MVKKTKKTAKKAESRKDSESKLSEDSVMEMIKAQVKKTGENLSKEEQNMQLDALKKVFIDGVQPFEAMGLPEGFTKALYKRAYDMYNLGQHVQANQIFRILCFLEPRAPRYHMGLAATNHQMGNYENAIYIYWTAFVMDPSTPAPLFHISDCYIHLEEPEMSYLMLEATKEQCGNKPEFAHLKQRCIMMMDGLNEKYHFEKKDLDKRKEGIFEELKKNAR